MSRKRSWLYRKKESVFSVIVSVGLISLIHSYVNTGSQNKLQQSVERQSPASPFATVPLAQQLDNVISVTRPVLSSEIEALTGSGDYRRAKELLLERALQAVAAADNERLALAISELGELALLQGDLGMAGVYLSEALELYEELGLDVELAGVHIQMGRLHLYDRKRARQASDSYDQLLLSRWNISQGRFYESEQALQQVVKTNLSLNRYGAAASAHETLYRGYASEHNIEQAQQSGIEAIKLHAASGNLQDAKRLLGVLIDNGLTNIDAEEIEQQLQSHYSEYEKSVAAIGAARDYGQLYNQMLARGDALQAWRFRQQAEASLANASKRAQYRRQPDVMVELYRSNTSMHNAKLSLQKATAVYSRYGLTDGMERSMQLREQIY